MLVTSDQCEKKSELEEGGREEKRETIVGSNGCEVSCENSEAANDVTPAAHRA